MNQQAYDEKKSTIDEQLEEIKEELESHRESFVRRPNTELVTDLEHLNETLEQINERFASGRYGYTDEDIFQQIDELGEEAEGIAERFEHSYTGEQRCFIRDLLVTDFGEKLFHYEGRFYISGPAVRVDDFSQVQEVIRATSSHIKMDNMGLGYVVYCG
jgi:hypothetical protein